MPDDDVARAFSRNPDKTAYWVVIRPTTENGADGWRATIPELGVSVAGFETEEEAIGAARAEHASRMSDPDYMRRANDLAVTNPDRFETYPFTYDEYETIMRQLVEGEVEVEPFLKMMSSGTPVRLPTNPRSPGDDDRPRDR